MTEALLAGWAWTSLDPWLQAMNPGVWWAISPLELCAVALSLAMVCFNLRVHPLGWPLAMASSLLYIALFARHRLYGEAGLQVLFIALSAWGWWQWLRGRDTQGDLLRVRRLGPRGALGATVAWLMLWPLIGLLLDHGTDSDVPYFDALPTAGSLVGQWLLARKWVENWPCWMAVNAVSVALFLSKSLWLTALLYAVFFLLACVGWRTWGRMATARPNGGLA